MNNVTRLSCLTFSSTNDVAVCSNKQNYRQFENLYEFISLSECSKQFRSHSVLCSHFYKLPATGTLFESQSKGWGSVFLLLILHIVPSSKSETRTDICKLKTSIEIEEIF